MNTKMCDRPHFDRMSDRVGELERTQAAQTEQIKTLFNITSVMQQTLSSAVNKLIVAVLIILCVLVFCVAYGALGDRGFNAVMRAAGSQIGTMDAAQSISTTPIKE